MTAMLSEFTTSEEGETSISAGDSTKGMQGLSVTHLPYRMSGCQLLDSVTSYAGV